MSPPRNAACHRRPTSRLAIVALVMPPLLAAGGDVALAQANTTVEAQLQQAAIALRTFDRFADRCTRSGGFDAEQSRRIARWRQEQRVEAVRERVGDRRLPPAQQQAMEAMWAKFDQQVAAQPGGNCTAAVAITGTPQAQFTSSAPALVGNADGSPPSRTGDAATSAKAAAAPAAVEPAVSAAAVEALVPRIEAFGFDTCMRMGVGGMLAVSTCPVVLFKNGDLLQDVEALRRPDQLDLHRQQHAGEWTKWRRSGGEIQLQRRKGWEKLAFQKTYAALPKDFRLDGRFQSLSGAGTTAVGGTSSVAAWRDYQFTRDGRVSRGVGVGSEAETTGGGGRSSVATNQRAAGKAGRYRIDGLLLAIDYDDGTSERRIVVTDPADPKSVVWLDGDGYVRR